MSSEDPVGLQFQSSLQNDIDDDDPHHNPIPHSLSRLSVCTNSRVCGVEEDEDEDDDVGYGLTRYMSGLSIESLELSESEKETNGRAIIAEVKECDESDKEKVKGGVLTRQETWRRKCRRMRSKNEEDDVVDEVGIGRRSMDFDEMKGCRDLGFDLEELDNIPSRLSVSFETSSGASSPISNWRISSPGDDPRDVKARLKMWAHAVAAASTSTSN